MQNDTDTAAAAITADVDTELAEDESTNGVVIADHSRLRLAN